MLGGDTIPFLRKWMADPLRVGAVAPSGRALAMAVTAEITPANAPVIELGPGTGVFTRALVARGIPENRLVLVEYGQEFADLVQRRFPEAQVLAMDAARLRNVPLFGGEKAGAVVSGLPLLSMPPRKIMMIVGSAFAHLRPGGSMYQFTYGPRCPVPRPILDRLGLEARKIGGALANLPPASVYRIRRRDA
jgi:phosphatidylethanolamine/phosphatidyl-N-methylethanolamine N-methyltransferase